MLVNINAQNLNTYLGTSPLIWYSYTVHLIAGILNNEPNNFYFQVTQKAENADMSVFHTQAKFFFFL